MIYPIHLQAIGFTPIEPAYHPLFQAIEKGDERFILNFSDECLNATAFNPQVLIQEAPHLLEKILTFSPEVAYHAVKMMRKMIYRVLIQNPTWMDRTSLSSFYFPIETIEKDDPCCFEFSTIFILIQEIVSNESIPTQCFERICQQVDHLNLLPYNQLPEKAQRIREIGRKLFESKAAIQSFSKETWGNILNHHLNEVENLQADPRNNLKRWENQITNFDKSIPFQAEQWVQNVLNVTITKKFIETATEHMQTVDSPEKIQQLLINRLNSVKATQFDIEEALDSISQKLYEKFQNKYLQSKKSLELQEKYRQIYCSHTGKIMLTPVIAEDGCSYDRAEIEKYFKELQNNKSSILSPVTGRLMGTYLVSDSERSTLISTVIRNNPMLLNLGLYPKFAKKRTFPSLEAPHPKRIEREPGKFNNGSSPVSYPSSERSFLKPLAPARRSQIPPSSASTLSHGRYIDPLLVFSGNPDLPNKEEWVRKIQENPTCADFYYHLGVILANQEKITLANKEVVTKRQLYLKAIYHNDFFAPAYNALGESLAKDEVVTLPNKTRRTKRELFCLAITLNEQFALAYSNLQALLANGESIEINGSLSMTKEQLISKLKSLREPLLT